MSVKAQAELLSLNRTSLYYKSKGPSEREVQLTRRIDAIYTECPFYGSRKIKAQLRREGWQVNRKLVQRLMRQMGLEAVCPKPNLSKRGAGKEHQIYPYVLRHFKLTRPQQLYGIDVLLIMFLPSDYGERSNMSASIYTNLKIPRKPAPLLEST